MAAAATAHGLNLHSNYSAGQPASLLSPTSPTHANSSLSPSSASTGGLPSPGMKYAVCILKYLVCSMEINKNTKF